MSIMQTAFQRQDKITEPLYVVSTLFNSQRFRIRWKHFEDFNKRIEESGALHYIAEVAFGDREFAITSSNNPRHIQLRSRDELWLKENALNIAISRLPANWKYVCWCDQDISWARDDFADEIKHKLQHYDFIQPWTYAHDLNSNHEITATYKSFCASHIDGEEWSLGSKAINSYYLKTIKKPGTTSYHAHPGFVWAARRSALDIVGGLPDVAICGEADFLAAIMLGQKVDVNILRKNYSVGYRRYLSEWQDRAKLIKKNIGKCEGSILHAYHGSKKLRKYFDRTRILVDTQYDPYKHLTLDTQGLWQLNHKAPIELRDRLREYFCQRNEDQLSD